MKHPNEPGSHLDVALESRRDEHTSTSIRSVRLADVKPEQVTWLWTGRIPRGMLTMLDGDPGIGKSTITLDLAARVSTGRPMPFEVGMRVPGGVILLGAEDSLAATIRPRLDAADADTTRVHAIVAVPQKGDPNAMPTHVKPIEGEIKRRGAELVVIDPVMAHLPEGVNSYKDSEIRKVLTPWAQMAERTGVAVVIVRHLRKGAGTALNRGGGSIAFVGAARSALLVGRDRAKPETCVLAHVKGNLALPPSALRYRMIDRNGIGVIEWLGVADGVTADDLAAIPDGLAGRVDADRIELALEGLQQVLANGPVPSTDVFRDVKAFAGCSPSTIRRASKQLGVVVEPMSGKSGRIQRWAWRLPGEPGDQCMGSDHLVVHDGHKQLELRTNGVTQPDDHFPDDHHDVIT